MVASLPMYDCFVPYDSSDAIWQKVKASAAATTDSLPTALDLFSSCYTIWTSGSKLSLTQSCGYPLVREYSKYLQVIGTPVYAAPGCSGATYKSAIVVSTRCNATTLDQLLASSKDLSLAANSFGSFSGWLMLLSALSDSYSPVHDASTASKLSRVVLTGSHIGSMKAVQSGLADIACIDCVSLALAQAHCPLLLKGLRIIGWGLPAPALPFVTNSNASAEDIAALRNGLTSMIQSTDMQVVHARQKHLLIGVDTTGAIDFSAYERAVNQHIAIAKRSPQTTALFDALPPGRPPRVNLSIPVVANAGAPASTIRVDLVSKLGDATWPEVDFAMLHGLKRFLARYLWDTIHTACCNVDGADDIAVAGKHTNIDSVLTVDLLFRALLPIVGEQLWPTLRDGGKPKLIFCSLRGTLLLLSGMFPCKATTSGNAAAVYNSSYDDIHQHTSWRTISRVARDALQHLRNLAEQQARESGVPLVASPCNEETEADPYWAGFMGAGAASLYEYFDDEHPSGSTAEPSETKDSSSEVIAKLWKADINLSSHLIRSSKSGTNGVIAYISAPRHNDRNDWANLVITENEAGIERWRDSRGHSAVRQHVAPWSYDHIRLHRGVLLGGLSGDQLILKRTVFLGPVEKPVVPTTTATTATCGDDMDQDERELSTLRIASEPTPSGTCGGGCPMSSTTRGFERHVVYWADIGPHLGSAKGISSDEVSAAGDKLVPGGVHVSLTEFKAMLISNEAAPFVTVDESMTSPL